MQMTISLSGIVNAGAQAQDVLPLYVLLARAVPDNMVEKVCFERTSFYLLSVPL